MEESPEQFEEEISNISNQLSELDIKKLKEQDGRLVPEIKAKKLEAEAKRNWDLFYKRNETRFFRDRRWTTREFEELLACSEESPHGDIKKKFMLEVGCGVGNLIYPLIEENRNDYFIYACDFSPRAVEFVKSNPLYNEERVIAFQCDVTTDDIFNNIQNESLDIITMIFVLSAIHPDKHQTVMKNLYKLLKPGGKLLFRDYGLYDMAQIRFKPGHKIADNFYMRQDGTRSFYFSENEFSMLARDIGYEILENNYVHRRTVNPKENIDAKRIFLQGKFMKPSFLKECMNYMLCRFIKGFLK